MRRRTRFSLATISLLAAVALAGCRPEPIVVTGPVLDAPPPPPSLLPAPIPQDHVAVLQVASAPSRPITRNVVTVDAQRPRTPLGRFPAGTHVRISVIEARWSPDPSSPFFDAAGKADLRCLSSGRPCVGGNAAFPLMGLILLTTPVNGPLGPAGDNACAPAERLFIPNGVEFAVPEDAELLLAPNDWEDDLGDNAGSIRVSVERSSGRAARGPKLTVDVDARHRGTSLGRFAAGQYVRISVLGGSWTSAPGAPFVSAGGRARSLCEASGGHVCPGGDRKAPAMGLILVMATCRTLPPQPMVERRFIPDGVELVLSQESDLALGPNDREDGCGNNAGAAIVDVQTQLP